MNEYDYIQAKQVQWALNQGITLIGSKGKRGRPAYTTKLNQNLFEPLEPQVRDCFMKADGSELIGTPDSPEKMQAVHSSSALSVNIFQYWMPNDRIPAIAKACKFCRNNVSESLVFEEKFPIAGLTNRFSPNIDVVIHNADSAQFKIFAIECKFREPYNPRGQKKLNPSYLNNKQIWKEIPRIFNLSKTIINKNGEDGFHHLDCAQLITHLLGLLTVYRKTEFRLLYLYYDAYGYEGAKHREEITKFLVEAKADGINFRSLSIQELIIHLSRKYRSEHEEYISYITNRYL